MIKYAILTSIMIAVVSFGGNALKGKIQSTLDGQSSTLNSVMQDLD